MKPVFSSFSLVCLFTLTGCTSSGNTNLVDAKPVSASPSVAPVAQDFCATMYGKALECASAEQKALVEGLRDPMLKDCRERIDRTPEEEKDELACTRKGCEDYRRCVEELSDKRQADRVKREVQAALKGGETMEDALASCKDGDIKDEEVKKLCLDLFKISAEALLKELKDIRDVGGDGLGKCFDLQATAEKLSSDEKTRADALCAEVEASMRSKEAIDAARRNLDGGTDEVPPACSEAVESLEKVPSEWARAKLLEVARTCYVDLGKEILPAQVGKLRTCERQVEQVYKAVEKYGLKDPALDPWIAKAAKKCR